MIILDYWYVKIDIVITPTNKPSCLSNGRPDGNSKTPSGLLLKCTSVTQITQLAFESLY